MAGISATRARPPRSVSRPQPTGGVSPLNRLQSIIVVLAVPAVGTAAYFATPYLQSPAGAVNSRTRLKLEQARDILQEFNRHEERLAAVLDALRETGVNVSPDASRIESLFEADRAILDQLDERFRDLNRGGSNTRLRDLNQRYQSAGGAPPEVEPGPQNLGGSLSSVSRTIESSLRWRDQSLTERTRLLDQAQAVVEEALAVTTGTASGSDDPEIHRLKGVIQSARAAALLRDAIRRRAAVEPQAHAIALLVADIKQHAVELNRPQQSELHERIDQLREQVESWQAALDENNRRIAQLERTIETIEAQIRTQREKARKARHTREKLEDLGADLLDPNGARRFAEQFEQASAEYAAATAAVHRLQFGGIQNAEIDETEDYVLGRYLPNPPDASMDFQRGLLAYRDDLARVTLERDRISQTLATLQADLEALESLDRRALADAEKAEDEIKDSREALKKAFTQYAELVTQVDDTLQKTLRQAKNAVSAFQAAQRAASDRTQQAADQIAGKTPPAVDRSPYKARSEARFLTGQMNNELAQARLLQATVLAVCWHSLERRIRTSQRAASADPSLDIDVTPLQESAQSARADAVDAARRAVREFEKSSRDLSRNWTVAAQAAAAHDLLADLESPAHRQTAISNYEASITGRESETFARPFVDRLNQLKRH